MCIRDRHNGSRGCSQPIACIAIRHHYKRRYIVGADPAFDHDRRYRILMRRPTFGDPTSLSQIVLMRPVLSLTICLFLAARDSGAQGPLSAQQSLGRDILRELIETNTTYSNGVAAGLGPPANEAGRH